MSGSVDHSEASADRAEDRARAARVWCELTKPQRAFLWWAHHWTGRDGSVGCGARGAQVRMADALVSRGLLEDVGMCVNYEDHSLPERPTYAITPFGCLVVAIDDSQVSPKHQEKP